MTYMYIRCLLYTHSRANDTYKVFPTQQRNRIHTGVAVCSLVTGVALTRRLVESADDTLSEYAGWVTYCCEETNK